MFTTQPTSANLLRKQERQRVYNAAYFAANRERIWARIWHITLPLLAPTLTLVGILTISGYFQLFAEPYVMTQGGPLQSTVSVLYYMFEQGFTWWKLGYAASAAVVLFALIYSLTTLQLRLTRRLSAP